MRKNQNIRPIGFLFLGLLFIIILILIYFASSANYWADWTDIRNKSFWMLLELLIIPFSLALIAYFLDKEEKKVDRELNLDNQRETLLQNCMNFISDLILNKDLRNSSYDSDVVSIAYAKIATTIIRLDGPRKSNLITFLSNLKLITSDASPNENPPLIYINSLKLDNTNFKRLNFSGSLLQWSTFENSILCGADFSNANLLSVNFQGCDARCAKFNNSNLTGADFSNADLSNANLSNANLSQANLRGAILENAIIKTAIFHETIMPDGIKFDPEAHIYF